MTSTATRVRLSEVADVNPHLSATLAPDDRVSFVPMSAVSAAAARVESPEIRRFAEVRKGFTSFQRGDVLVAKITPCFENGKIAQADIPQDIGFGSTEFHVVRPIGARLDGRYLLHLLRQDSVRQAGERRMTGSGGQRRVPAEFIRDLQFDLPTLSEQRRIAEVLDRADALRAKRAETEALLMSLQLALFVEMFGDPTDNPRHWKVKPLESLCSLSGQYGAGVPATQYVPDRPRYIRITDITDDGDLSASPVGPSGDRSAWEHLLLQDGDLLFARSGATVGKTYLYKSRAGKCVFAGYLIRFRPNPALVLPEYLFHFTRTSAYRAWVGSRQRVVAQPNINARQYANELFVPVPPAELQHVFVARLKLIENVGLQTAAASRLSDELLASMRDRAFRGEL